jgi:hypothetical protein
MVISYLLIFPINVSFETRKYHTSYIVKQNRPYIHMTEGVFYILAYELGVLVWSVLGPAVKYWLLL